MIDLIKIQTKYNLNNLSIINEINVGLINKTYLLQNQDNKFIIQVMNTKIFTDLEIMDNNYSLINSVFESSEKVTLIPLKFLRNINGNIFTRIDENVVRIARYIDNTTILKKELTPTHFYNMAYQLGNFHEIVNRKNIPIREPIQDFLNFDSRIFCFNKALKLANIERLEMSEDILQWFVQNGEVIHDWNEDLKKYKLRTIHGDPKWNNFLFNSDEHVCALIDWDTVMPGYIHYDIGDLLRTGSSLSNESDPEPIFCQTNFEKILEGYFKSNFYNSINEFEKSRIKYAALPIIYIQALRFYTDFLNNDIYYAISYPMENIDRTKNQISLYNNIEFYLTRN